MLALLSFRADLFSAPRAVDRRRHAITLDDAGGALRRHSPPKSFEKATSRLGCFTSAFLATASGGRQGDLGSSGSSFIPCRRDTRGYRAVRLRLRLERRFSKGGICQARADVGRDRPRPQKATMTRPAPSTMPAARMAQPLGCDPLLPGVALTTFDLSERKEAE